MRNIFKLNCEYRFQKCLFNSGIIKKFLYYGF
jgi:hypothetical protein